MVKEQAIYKNTSDQNRRCKISGAGAGAGIVYSKNIKDADEAGKMNRGKATEITSNKYRMGVGMVQII